MAEQPLELRRINWSECCGFTHLFRTFRMAVRPGKLALATAGVILTFLWGWTLDGIWSDKARPLPGELDAYWQVINMREWRESATAAQINRLQALYAVLPVDMPADLATKYKENPDEGISSIQKVIKEQYVKLTQNANDAKRAETARDYNRYYLQAESLRPRGIFTSFVTYETNVLKQAMDAGASLNIIGGLRDVLNARREMVDVVPQEPTSSIGVLGCVFLMLRGKQWLVTEHPWFAGLLGAGALLIWALIGGAVCRMAALNFARDEGISPRAALDFSLRKYVGFLTAPLLPVGMIALVGVLLLLGGAFMAIPFIGEVIGSLALPLGLLGGFIIALVLIGFLAGGSLFYPTIAVEGSDSFDAMSRSYSYIFSKPWRALFYALIAFVYGALCYLFIRIFALLLLKSTRTFVSTGTDMFTDRPGTGSVDASKLEAMWSNPTFEHLWRPPSPLGMHNLEPFGAWFITLWVALVIAVLVGFVVSFFYSASTIIYFLLRREVDATDLDDVYVEDEEAELDTGSVTAPVSAGSISPTVPPDAPAPAPPPPPAPEEPPPTA